MSATGRAPSSATITRFPSRRYDRVAISLHWLIAAAILTLLLSGLWMSDAIREPVSKAFAFRVFQWHKALGLIVLLLSAARLAWRLTHTPPPLPGSMGRLQRAVATTSHAAFYVLMIGMPIVGWAMVSASPIGLKTMIFGLFEWPHLPVLSTLANKAPVESALRSLHAAGGYVFAGLAVLHIAAALKHHFVDRDDVLTRMLPGPAPVVVEAAAKRPKPNGRMPDAMAPRPAAGRQQAGPSKLPAWALPAAGLVLVAAVATTLIGPEEKPAGKTAPAAQPGPRSASSGQGWVVDQAQSTIGFAGTHTGTEFKGTFKTWTAKIVFDPANLPAASATVEIDLASAKTGDTTYDGTLPDSDWFDTSKSPRATFATTAITAKGGSSYTAAGTLTIRGIAVPVVLDFDLTIDGATARMRGETRLKRLDFGIGRGSDSGGSWVSLDIPVSVNLVARRVP